MNEERMKNGEERRKTFTDLLMEHLGSVTEAPRLGFFSRKQFSSAISSKYEVPIRLNPFLLHSSPYL